MKKKGIIDLIVSIILFVTASFILLLPIFKVKEIKLVLIIIFGVYAFLKLVQFLFIFDEKDYESLFTFLISLIALFIVNFIDLKTKNIVLILLIWMGFMCLIKLKKADFYHDKENKMWILRLFILFVFLTSGILMGINLMYANEIIVIGYFFLINSLLDAIDPIVNYLLENKK